MVTSAEYIANGHIIILTTVGVSSSGEAPISNKALLGTGAQVTMISDKVLEGPRPRPIGLMSIIPVTGEPYKATRYRVGIDFPIAGQSVNVGRAVGAHSVQRGKDLPVGALPSAPTTMMSCPE